MLAQQEGQQHKHAPIVHDPPHVNVPIAEALLVLRDQVDVFGHQQGLVCCCGVTDSVCGERQLQRVTQGQAGPQEPSWRTGFLPSQRGHTWQGGRVPVKLPLPNPQSGQAIGQSPYVTNFTTASRGLCDTSP